MLDAYVSQEYRAYNEMHIQVVLTLCLRVLSADNLCEQVGPKSGPTSHMSGLICTKLFHTLMVHLKLFLEKFDFQKLSMHKNKHANLPSRQRVKIFSAGYQLKDSADQN